MQYAININQEKLADSKLDLIDASILEYLYHLCSSVSQQVEKNRIVDDYGVWTWVDLPTLAKEMPLLRIKNSTALSRRIPKIESEKFIVSKRGAGNKLYIKLTPKCDGLYRGPKTEMTSNISEMTDIITGIKESEPEMTKRSSRNDGYHRSIYDSSTKDSKNTNAIALGKREVSRVDNRNVDITEGISLLEELFGHPPQKQTLNRFALKRLYAKFGKDIALRAMRFAKQVRGEDKYAPGIYNFMDLEEKWDQLVDYGKEKARSVPKAMKASDIAKMMKGTPARVTQDA